MGLAVTVVFLKRKERAILFGFLLPLAFAFLVSLTPDINVNHKYVMISYAFTAIFWGWFMRESFLMGKQAGRNGQAEVSARFFVSVLL